jgi:ABC transport system ATP-binding/permease protein
MALVTLRGVTAAFGGPPVLDGVDLAIEPKERICLVGRNGAGKSTLLRVIAREIAPDSGEIDSGRGVRVAALAQEVPASLEGACADVVRAGLSGGAAPAKEREHEIAAVLTRLGLDGSAPCASLSGGQRRRALLARALVGEPDVLLLDEPTNHLDIDAIVLLETLLLRFPGAVVFVSHDRMLTDRLATRIVDLDRGRLSSWPGSYRTYLEKKRDALEAEQAQRAKLDKRLAEEEAWLRKGIKARRTRNEGRVRALLAMRERVRARRVGQGTAKLELEAGGRSSKKIVEARGVSFAYGAGEKEVVRGFSGVVWRGDKIGIIGANGVGKTTLLGLLLGALAPSSGDVRLGDNLEIAYLDQLRAQLDPERSVRENVVESGDTVVIDGRPRHVYSYLEDFLFSKERARTPVKVLSGGEKNRLLLAKLFTKPANVLVLDEPTNDLDMETLELLEDLLVEYAGTVLLVSHDRAFLNNVATSTFVFGGEGRIDEYVGGYDDWLAQRAPPKEEVAPKAPRARAERERPAKPRSLTFKERFELDALPQAIEALEAEVAAHRATLADPGFYRSAGPRTAQVTAALESAEESLAAAYDRWAELEAIREASAKQP